MRKAFFLVLPLFVCLSFTHNIDKLIGKWHIEKAVYENGKEAKEGGFLEFLKDGKVQGGSTGKKASRFGEWNYNEKDSILTLSSKEKRGDDGDYKVLKLIDSLLILKRGRMEIHLKKS